MTLHIKIIEPQIYLLPKLLDTFMMPNKTQSQILLDIIQSRPEVSVGIPLSMQ